MVTYEIVLKMIFLSQRFLKTLVNNKLLKSKGGIILAGKVAALSFQEKINNYLQRRMT